MMQMGPAFLGYNLSALLMMISGVFYLVCAFFLWKPYQREKNELVGALLAFLIYQAIGMFFMGLQIQTMTISYWYIATIAVFVGSVYMLKFPFSSFSRITRRAVFYLSLLVVLAVFVWFMQTPERQKALVNFTLWYDLAINGLIVGGSILLFGFGTKETWLRIKTLGGGSGVVSCCVVANSAMLGGAVLTSSIFQFAAPVIILGSLAIARRNQNKARSY